MVNGFGTVKKYYFLQAIAKWIKRYCFGDRLIMAYRTPSYTHFTTPDFILTVIIASDKKMLLFWVNVPDKIF